MYFVISLSKTDVSRNSNKMTDTYTQTADDH